MDELNLIDLRKMKESKIENLINSVKAEGRKMSEVEDNFITSTKEEIKKLDTEIEEKRKQVKVSFSNEPKQEERFSLLKTIRDNVEGRGMSEVTKSVMDAGKKSFTDSNISLRGSIFLPLETRSALVAVGANVGQEFVPEDKFDLITGLKAKTVLGQAGASFYTNLTGDVSIPVYNGSSVSWATENGAAADGGGATSEVTLSPKRLTAYVDISKQLLNQTSFSVEQKIMEDLNRAILVEVEKTVFDAASGNTSRPAGLFYNVSYTATLTGATSFAKVVGMKAAVDTANALNGSLAYVTNPTLGATLETTSVDTGSGIMIMNNGKIGGYPVYVTSNVPAVSPGQGIIYGNWNDYIVGQWGGYDITVDPYTQAGAGKIRLVVNTYWDFKPSRTASFSINKLS